MVGGSLTLVLMLRGIILKILESGRRLEKPNNAACAPETYV